MAVLLVRPGIAMEVAPGRVALYSPLSSNKASGPPSATLPLTQIGSGLIGWWDASSPENLLGVNGSVVGAWNAPGNELQDLSGSGHNLPSFSSAGSRAIVQIYGHLSGLLGGAGYPVTTSGLLQPALDPNSGWQLPTQPLSSTEDWTLFLVWSRPNWRQGSNSDGSPITLLTIGSTPILQVDSAGGSNRLVLFPGAGQVITTSSITRRHTHSVVLRFSPSGGADLWLDQSQVAQSVSPGSAMFSGPALLLHDGTPLGAAQCWLHEAAVWTQAINNAAILSVLAYTTRWVLGPRKGIYIVFNGQSNAINYTEVDGAAALIARGVAWYLGALAYNVLATTTNQTNFTMASGHGIYDVASAGYPGSFVQDPGDGSNPSTWSLGADGLAVEQAVSGFPAEDLSDMSVIVWPWNETDSLRQYSELSTFQAAALRFLSLLRSMLGDTANRIPLVWWNGIPYGTDGGICMHREVVQTLAADSAANVVIGNPQTSDSNPRGSSWDPTTGIATGGDPAHRDSVDNLRFAVLAAPIVARSLISSGFGDSINTIPTALPQRGGPSISHVYMKSGTTLIVTVLHDSGNDLIVPLQAALGVGFAVMDGGSPATPGNIVAAVSCQRLDPTHLQVELASSLQNAAAACLLFYPYGPQQIGRGNAVTDNFSTLTMPDGWDASTELGSSWGVNFPLAATFAGIQLSTTLT